MNTMSSEITGVSIVYSIVCSGVDQRKHQSSALVAYVRGIHWWPVNSTHKGPVTRKMFPFADVIMQNSFKSRELLLAISRDLSWGWVYGRYYVLSCFPLRTKMRIFLNKKCIWNCRLRSGGHFVFPAAFFPVHVYSVPPGAHIIWVMLIDIMSRERTMC